MKSLLYISMFVFLGSNIHAQQLTQEPSTYEYGFTFNPAMTGLDNTMSFGGIYRKQWLGFDGSPQHMGVFGQYPFFDLNISGGGYLIYDTEGPLKSATVGGTVSYQLKELLSYSDQLSLGIGVKFNNTSINFDQLIARDQVSFAQNYSSESVNHLGVDFGAFYVTDGSYSFETRFFGGLGIQNLQSIFISDEKDNRFYDQTTHINLVAGYDYRKFKFGYKKQGYNFFFKPLIWIDYAAFSPLRVLVGADAGMADFLYGGLYISSESSIHMKFAINIKNESMGDGGLKIELFPSFNFGKLKKTKGFSFDLGVAYVMDMN